MLQDHKGKEEVKDPFYAPLERTMQSFRYRNSKGTLRREFTEDELKKARQDIYHKLKKGELKPLFNEETDPMLQKFDHGNIHSHL